jgi:hypothetical protein
MLGTARISPWIEKQSRREYQVPWADRCLTTTSGDFSRLFLFVLLGLTLCCQCAIGQTACGSVRTVLPTVVVPTGGASIPNPAVHCPLGPDGLDINGVEQGVPPFALISVGVPLLLPYKGACVAECSGVSALPPPSSCYEPPTLPTPPPQVGPPINPNAGPSIGPAPHGGPFPRLPKSPILIFP